MITTTTHKLKVSALSDTEILLERTFNAPRALVFDAMTKPEHIRKWWGHGHGELVVCEVDFRVGGGYRFVQRSEDGRENPFKGEYKEIAAPERIVQSEIYDVSPFSGFPAITTLKLTQVGNTTELTIHVSHQSKDIRDAHLNSGMEQGASQSYDQLEKILEDLR